MSDEYQLIMDPVLDKQDLCDKARPRMHKSTLNKTKACHYAIDRGVGNPEQQNPVILDQNTKTPS
jgi:hypothetical protein